ncbi:ATP-grasp fold amidoligase family protein [Algoriphagus marinus]|uniref:ATP-grasp fold amidoligase family protein n=1 Tax=Algoriphagus marinus TaxID=1925762 RepID=UPI00094BA2B2|nr:ATP-grasp fold amidoligase family protein [Algoriphagus marinus]
MSKISIEIQRIRDSFYNLRQRVLGYPKLKKSFYFLHGYKLNLESPTTLPERIIHKKIHDRNPLIVLTSDKLKVRDYIKDVLGEEAANEILIPIYHVSKTGLDIPHQEWDFEFFMKANHFSGGNMLVKPGEDPDLVKENCQKWLSSSYGQGMHEWAYRDIPRRIICEKVLRDENGKIPQDVKIYCFHGKARMILFVSDRFEGQKRLYTDENLNPIYGVMMDGSLQLEQIPNFPLLDQMKEIAEKLASPFEFVRVDLYSIGTRIFFGEITQYPGSGHSVIDDYDYSLALGNLCIPENKDITFYEMLDLVKKKKTSKTDKTRSA